MSNQYEIFLRHIIDHGISKNDRTNVGTYSIFGYQMRFKLFEGFPIITTKKLHVKSIFIELLWFLKGDSNIKWLNQNGVTIWDKWSRNDGNLGPIYGKQWRSWPTYDGKYVDQISEVIRSIKHNPDSRRMIVSAWNVAQIDEMAIPPCHVLFQFYVSNGQLSCHLYQRSADAFIGVPFNIASYSLLVHLVAQQTGLQVGEFIWTGGDCHIYKNHMDKAILQLSRISYPYPILKIMRKPCSIFEYKYEDFKLINYKAHESIKASVAV